jgi:hypothetical protein
MTQQGPQQSKLGPSRGGASSRSSIQRLTTYVSVLPLFRFATPPHLQRTTRSQGRWKKEIDQRQTALWSRWSLESEPRSCVVETCSLGIDAPRQQPVPLQREVFASLHLYSKFLFSLFALLTDRHMRSACLTIRKNLKIPLFRYAPKDAQYTDLASSIKIPPGRLLSLYHIITPRMSLREAQPRPQLLR